MRGVLGGRRRCIFRGRGDGEVGLGCEVGVVRIGL